MAQLQLQSRKTHKPAEPAKPVAPEPEVEATEADESEETQPAKKHEQNMYVSGFQSRRWAWAVEDAKGEQSFAVVTEEFARRTFAQVKNGTLYKNVDVWWRGAEKQPDLIAVETK